jgi:hypothetical protein
MPKEDEEQFFEQIAGGQSARDTAPARLKSRIYSTLMQRETRTGPLRDISETESAGRRLCVFEKLVEISPAGTAFKSLNYCRVCHARILAEHLEKAPIYWPHCPYSAFHHPAKV